MHWEGQRSNAMCTWTRGIWPKVGVIHGTLNFQHVIFSSANFYRNCIGVFGEWSIWSHCDRTCGAGVMTRRRHCGEAACKIDKAGRGDEDEKACNTQECPGKF
jgi:hypothetical protein